MRNLRQSFLGAYMTRCPRQAQYQYGIGVPKVEQPTPAALFVGSQFHQAYAFAYQYKLTEGEDYPLASLIEDIFLPNWEMRTVPEGEDPITALDWGEQSESQHRTDCIACIQSYYPLYRRTKPLAVEVPQSLSIDDSTLTTKLDLLTPTGVVEMKTSTPSLRRGQQYFYAYEAARVHWHPQPLLHMVIMGLVPPYTFHVVGKGNEPLVQEIDVYHTSQQVEAWKAQVVLPALQAIKAGIFPARPGSACATCPLARDSRCGMLLG